MIATIKCVNELIHNSWPAWVSGDNNKTVPKFNWVLFSANWENVPQKNLLLFGFLEKAMEPYLVAKVCRIPENGWTLESEYNRLVELWQCLGEQALSRLPKPMIMGEVERRQALITSYLPGQSLLHLNRSIFLDNGVHLKQLMLDAARTLTFFHNESSIPLIASERTNHQFAEKTRVFSQLFPVNKSELQLLNKIEQVIEKKNSLADNKILIHGDFWHGNMIRNAEHKSLMLIDWQFARWSTDASLDVYLFILASAVAAAPTYLTKEQKVQTAVVILLQWQKKEIAAYLKAYTIPHGCVLLDEKYGMLACCVEMAVRSKFEFNYHQKDDIIWYMLFCELADIF